MPALRRTRSEEVGSVGDLGCDAVVGTASFVFDAAILIAVIAAAFFFAATDAFPSPDRRRIYRLGPRKRSPS